MGDGAEGLVDAQARLQDRLAELEEARTNHRRPVKDPESMRQLESLRLARAEVQRQSSATEHPIRREQLVRALEDLDRRIAELSERLA
jgi:hypothetical protein